MENFAEIFHSSRANSALIFVMLKEYPTVIDQLQRANSLADDSEALFVVINDDIRSTHDGIDRLRVKRRTLAPDLLSHCLKVRTDVMLTMTPGFCMTIGTNTSSIIIKERITI
jgi:hypothetical protein